MYAGVNACNIAYKLGKSYCYILLFNSNNIFHNKSRNKVWEKIKVEHIMKDHLVMTSALNSHFY